MKMATRIVAATAFTMFAAAAAPAAVDICSTPNCAPWDSNVLIDQGDAGVTIIGTLNDHPDVEVEFSSTSDNSLLAPAEGQARVSAADGSFTNMTFQLLNGTFSSAVFNIDALADGSVTITVFAPNYSEIFTLNASGQNFFGVSGGTFTGVTIQSTVALADLAQVRLGGILPASAVPEPATWAMMLIGFGAVGYAMRRRPTRRLLQAV